VAFARQYTEGIVPDAYENVGAMGGMAAEELVSGVITTGAESGLQTSTHLARMMVGRWGVSERIGPVQVLPEEGARVSLASQKGYLMMSPKK
jgi:cell division protease FtsH